MDTPLPLPVSGDNPSKGTCRRINEAEKMNRNQVIIVAIICMTIIFIVSTVSPAGSGWETCTGFQLRPVT